MKLPEEKAYCHIESAHQNDRLHD